MNDMNTTPPARPATLGKVLADLFKKIKRRSELVLELDQHPDTTPEQMALCHARSKVFHDQTRPSWETLRKDLALIHVDLVAYDRLPFVTSPFVGTPHQRLLPLSHVKSLIRKAKKTPQ